MDGISPQEARAPGFHRVSFRDFERAIVSEGLLRVARHWLEATRGRLMPAWRDIDPAAIAEELPNLWFYAYDQTDNNFVVRLVGDRISDAFGRDLRGLTMKEMYPPSAYPLFFARTKRVMCEPVLARSHGLLDRHGEENLVGERIVLPLADGGAEGAGVLGAWHFTTAARSGDAERDVWQWFAIS